MRQIPLKVQLDDNATFDNFFIGSNRQLLSRMKSAAQTRNEFIYIWGSIESGKTHLAQALCSEFNKAGLSSAYLPLGDSNLTSEILQGMNFMDLVCIDELEKVEGNSSWENALFDLYNNLKNENRSLVVFSDKAPAQTQFSLADLKSRLTAMEVYKLESMDDEQKVELFISRASHRGLEVPPEVVKFLITRKSRSVAALMAMLEQIDHSSMALQRKVTIPLVKELFDL
ncbi:DnaA regulatory inactivator Hda [Aliikangiella sp. G2MR2-5]|uniref:DnaA regulatory inactivator Hda n=1 Tax=Aliikangiella sp. G2MR2-5 TaxID=2788943 RepID=UPI0018AABC30|nr:DnaA regulatory inactivator Hda [Aliikangiella sp. G2MR2-5]